MPGYGWEQGEYNSPWVNILISIEGVGAARDRCHCDFGLDSFDMRVTDVDGKNYRLFVEALDKDVACCVVCAARAEAAPDVGDPRGVPADREEEPRDCRRAEWLSLPAGLSLDARRGSAMARGRPSTRVGEASARHSTRLPLLWPLPSLWPLAWLHIEQAEK